MGRRPAGCESSFWLPEKVTSSKAKPHPGLLFLRLLPARAVLGGVPEVLPSVYTSRSAALASAKRRFSMISGGSQSPAAAMGHRKSQGAILDEALSKRRTSVVDISSLNVLVIDDEATTRLILQNMLQKAGYRRT